jgi:hypothetical protein
VDQVKTGTIFRTNKDKDNPYVQINKQVFEDTRISWAAKGLMGYLLSKPDGWTVRFYDLVNHGPQKRNALQRVLKELARYGYMNRKRIRNEAGRFEYVTEVYELPVLVEAKAAPTAEEEGDVAA